MNEKIALIILDFISLCADASQSMCAGSITKEIEACAKKNFDDSDETLNTAYNELAKRLNSSDRRTLIRAEKEWLAYKETTCQEAFDETFPGDEAGIDRWTCLDQITRARIEELHYLNAGIGALGFYKAMDLLPKLYEDGSSEKFVSKLLDIYGKDSNRNWHSYVDDNCKLAVSRLHGSHSECIARQEFYRY
jgi:uncharacterized protein YecT (DUF1311 family)